MACRLALAVVAVADGPLMWQACTIDRTTRTVRIYLDGRRVNNGDRRRILKALRRARVKVEPGETVTGWLWAGGGLLLWEKDRA